MNDQEDHLVKEAERVAASFNKSNFLYEDHFMWP